MNLQNDRWCFFPQLASTCSTSASSCTCTETWPFMPLLYLYHWWRLHGEFRISHLVIVLDINSWNISFMFWMLKLVQPLKPDLFQFSCRSKKNLSVIKTQLISYGRCFHISLFKPMQTFVCHQCGIFFGPFFIEPVCYFNSLVCTDKLQK